MDLSVHADPATLGQAAGTQAADLLADLLATRDRVRLVLATGASQFATLATLVGRSDLDWSRVEVFHLDEYLGIPETHPASFRRYLRERVIDRLPGVTFHGVRGDAPDPLAECCRLGDLISTAPVDLMLLGIGENAHLAFNDPPADVTTTMPYLIVPLDEACRRQQLGEGWFPSLEAVPTRAISMSVRQMLTARTLIASVPDTRKAEAVRAALEGPVTPMVPASYLRSHPRCHLHLDVASASRLQRVPA